MQELEVTHSLNGGRPPSHLGSGEVPPGHHRRLLYQAQRHVPRDSRQGCQMTTTTTSGGVRLCLRQEGQPAGYIPEFRSPTSHVWSTAGSGSVDGLVERRKLDPEVVGDHWPKPVQGAAELFGLVRHQGRQTYYKVGVRLSQKRTTEAAVCDLDPLGLQAIVPCRGWASDGRGHVGVSDGP